MSDVDDDREDGFCCDCLLMVKMCVYLRRTICLMAIITALHDAVVSESKSAITLT